MAAGATKATLVDAADGECALNPSRGNTGWGVGTEAFGSPIAARAATPPLIAVLRDDTARWQQRRDQRDEVARLRAELAASNQIEPRETSPQPTSPSSTR